MGNKNKQNGKNGEEISSKEVKVFLSQDDVKILVLDTSVPMHDPRCFSKFGKNLLIIPIWQLEELDGLKKSPNGRGAIARECINRLDQVFNSSLIKLENGGMMLIDTRGGNLEGLPVGMKENNDNRIVSLSTIWKRQYPSKKVVLVSRDVNLRAKARGCKIEAQDYKNDKRLNSISDLYHGFAVIKINDQTLLSKLYQNGSLDANRLRSDENLGLLENQCCKLLFAGTDKYALAVYKKSAEEFVLAKKPQDFLKGKETQKNGGDVIPRNDEQALAFHLLMDPGIKLLTLEGSAGTGKTLLALKAAYDQLGKRYEQIVIYRPNYEIGQPLGFLPGSLSEKFDPWKRPIVENLKLIMKNTKQVKDGIGLDAMDDFIKDCSISIEPINFIRGATINNAYIIFDEGQNIRPEDARTLITRAGEGSKVVFTGDTSQIDNEYLDATSCGITAVIEAFKGDEDFGHIILKKGERSRLAEKAARLM